MKRTISIASLLAAGLLLASIPASAQQAAAPPDFLNGQASISLLGTSSVDSSKFQEYRDLSNGIFGPQFSVAGSRKAINFSLFGENIRQDDQRYGGQALFSWGKVGFDYNQILHNMGNNGLSLFTETSPGVWSMNGTTRQHLGDAAEAIVNASRTYPFYTSLLAPSIASANSVNLTGLRKRGDIEFQLGQKLPFDLSLTYMREVKTGARGASGGDILGGVSPVVDVPEPMNEVVQDFGIRWAYNLSKANFHATFNRNVYNDRIDALVIDNPFRATDLAYRSTGSGAAALAVGGPADAGFSTAPDNQATRGAFGAQFKFARQTRITADLAFGTWTQNAPFLPFTTNSTVTAADGTIATSLSLLPQPSLNGKINTTMLNFAFSSRPVPHLGVRLRYRSYDQANKTVGVNWTGSTSGTPDRSWATATPTTDAPFGGFATANPYSSKTARFEAQVSYDIKDVTLEAVLQHAALDRTYREATSGNDNAYGFAAVYHAKDWLGFRGSVNQLHRTAKGNPDLTTFLGYQSDEAERKTNRAAVDIEITPSPIFGFTFAYARRHSDYPNRPQRVAATPSTAPAELGAGLLSANYDEYTAEFDVTPSARAELNLFYTYEKNTTDTQRISPSGFSSAAVDFYRWNGLDKGNTFGATAVFHVVPEKWTFSLNAQRQKVDGLLGVNFNLSSAAGLTFLSGRAPLGGPQDITQYDDTTWTTFLAQIDRTFASWTLSFGYTYEKYDLGDAFTGGTSIFPQSVLFYMKADDGSYKASLGFVKLGYRF